MAKSREQSEINTSSTSNNATVTSDTAPIKIAKNVAKVGLVGFGAAAVFSPLDVVMHSLHTKSGKPFSFTGLPLYALSASKAAIYGYPAAAKAATVKNGVLIQRHGLEDKSHGVEEKVSEAGELSGELREKNNTTKKSAPYVDVAISAALGGIDTTFTQYLGNVRNWKYQEKLTEKTEQPFKMPQPKSASDYFKMFKVGYDVRASRNILTVYGYVANPKINDFYKTYLPTAQYGNFATIAGTLTSGFTVGAVGNVFDIIYKNKVVQTCPETIKSPSAFSITKDLMAKEGPKAFKRGLFTSVVYASIGYGVIPVLEKHADKIIDTTGTYFSKAKNSTFFKTMKKDMEAQQKESMKLHEQGRDDPAFPKNGPFGS